MGWMSVARAAAKIMVVAALAGCARVPPTLALDPVAPPDMRFAMADGAVLPARVWAVPPGVAAQGVILWLHGFTDSRDGFELAGPVFAASGWAVVAPDQRGFGATASRGTWPGTARLVDDAAGVAAQLRARFPGRLVLMGESMGGAVALCLAARPATRVDATVLLSPAVWGWGQLDPRLAAALWAADGIAPGWRPNPADVPADIWATDNIEALRRLARDPLTIRRPTVATLRGLVDLMTAAQKAAPDVRGPVLVLAGRRDRVVPQAAMAVAWGRLPATARRGFYPNGYHLLLRDRDRALVAADILAWLRDPGAWLPSGADVAAGAWTAAGSSAGEPAEALPAGVLDGVGERPVWPF